MAMQVLSYELIKRLDSNHRIKKILEIVKKGDIVMIEGKLTSEEETQLISNALANVSGKFSGIEVAYLDSFKAETVFDMVKDKLLKAIAKALMATPQIPIKCMCFILFIIYCFNKTNSCINFFFFLSNSLFTFSFNFIGKFTIIIPIEYSFTSSTSPKNDFSVFRV